jgi:hypothetical protein
MILKKVKIIRTEQQLIAHVASLYGEAFGISFGPVFEPMKVISFQRVGKARDDASRS